VKTTIADVNQAMAEMSTQVQAQFNGVTAALEDKLTAVVDATGASAIYTLKTGVRINGIMYNAGMSIAVLAESGQPVVTRIGFNANQFVLMSGSGNTQYSPFAVVNGQVFISDAFIRNASIDGVKIKDATIKGAKIADASIDYAKITDTLQSANFSDASHTGWALYKNGDGKFYGTVAAEKIEGDISAIWTFSSMLITQGNITSKSVVWEGGSRYAVRICIPYFHGSIASTRDDQVYRWRILINGQTAFGWFTSTGTTTVENESAGFVDVPAGVTNVKITVQIERVSGNIGNTLYFSLQPFAIIVSPATARFSG
ncbi:phage tail tip fiber protein, partial [Kluyvera intermedia]